MPPFVSASDAPTLAERGKDAAGIALIALLLGIPMIGLTTADQGGSLQVLTRWPLLGAFVAAAFCGRLLLRCELTVPRCAHRFGTDGAVWQFGNALPILSVWENPEFRKLIRNAIRWCTDGQA